LKFDRVEIVDIECGRVLDYCDFHYGNEFADFERSFLDELPVNLQESWAARLQGGTVYSEERDDFLETLK
jgi:hypothetical protein